MSVSNYFRKGDKSMQSVIVNHAFFRPLLCAFESSWFFLRFFQRNFHFFNMDRMLKLEGRKIRSLFENLKQMTHDFLTDQKYVEIYFPNKNSNCVKHTKGVGYYRFLKLFFPLAPNLGLAPPFFNLLLNFGAS